MTKQMQLSLFQEPITAPVDLKTARSGTFVDNMALPVHRWFRYSAGFSAEWVEQTLAAWQIEPHHLVLDPFAGSGTVLIACEKMGISRAPRSTPSNWTNRCTHPDYTFF